MKVVWISLPQATITPLPTGQDSPIVLYHKGTVLSTDNLQKTNTLLQVIQKSQKILFS